MRRTLVNFAPDLDDVARRYIESSEAQHGDRQLARWEAELWWKLFMDSAFAQLQDTWEPEEQ